MIANQFYLRIMRGDLEAVRQLAWALSLTIIAIYIAPYIGLGEKNKWMVWDNLDSNYVAYKVLLESGALFASNSAVIEQPLGGLPRSTFASEFDAFVWLYKFLGAEWAYITNRVLMTLIAFIGMYLLLSSHVLRTKEDEPIAIGVALCFAILPFWPFGGLSVAGQPLALYALLNIRQGDHRWFNWSIPVLYPFYSSLVLSGFFFLVMASAIWLYDLFRGRKSLGLFAALAVMAIFYVFSHYRLFIDFLISSDYVSHRSEFGPFGEASVKGFFLEAAEMFYSGHAHGQSLQSFVLLPFIALSSLLVVFFGEHRHRFLFSAVGLSLVAISLLYGFKAWPPAAQAMAPIKAAIPMQLDRFYFLSPMFWMLLFAIALSCTIKFAPQLRFVCMVVVGAQVVYSATQHEVITNRGSPTVAAFFAQSQFERVKNEIDLPVEAYRVASIGFHPSVALYNGFHTLDGYWPNYPLSYKHKFRKIIAGELEKDESLKKYFDSWGSRAYMFNHVTGKNMLVTAGNDIVLTGESYDWSAFYALGGRYVLSAVEIDIVPNSSLSLVKKFIDDRSAWDIYLYQVNENAFNDYSHSMPVPKHPISS